MLLSGCISYNTPGDLTLKSVEAVDLQEQLEFSSEVRTDKAQRLLLKVTFTSSRDLRELTGGFWGYTLGAVANLCDSSGSHVLAWPTVYSGGKPIRWWAKSSAPIREDNLFDYYVFIPAEAKAREISPGKPYWTAYNLRVRSQDVCFDIRGGNEGGFGYRSNTVRISNKEIKAALRGIPNQLIDRDAIPPPP